MSHPSQSMYLGDRLSHKRPAHRIGHARRPRTWVGECSTAAARSRVGDETAARAGDPVSLTAAELGVPVALGNTFLEVGVHMACALPEVEWLEYSFQNFEHLVEKPITIKDGWAYAPNEPGHGLVLRRGV